MNLISIPILSVIVIIHITHRYLPDKAHIIKNINIAKRASQYESE